MLIDLGYVVVDVLGINTIYTPVYLPLCEYEQNQPPCADVGLLLNIALTRSFGPY